MISPKLIAYVVLALAAILAAGLVVHAVRESGARDERDTINTENRRAGDAGENARLGRRDCVAGGMRWDFATGRCVGRP